MGDMLKALEGVATIIIAGYVAFIGTMQWRTAHEKLRLDLYDKRFDIYMRTWRFIDMLVRWEYSTDEEMEQDPLIRSAFARAYRESRFLFGKESEPYRLLQTLNKCAMDVMFISHNDPSLNDEKIIQRNKSLTWIYGCADLLDESMERYLDFQHLQAATSEELLNSPD